MFGISVIKKIKIKTTMWSHCTILEWLLKMIIKANAGMDADKMDYTYIT